ncbi:MAG: hypothetical protein AB7O95_01410 [Geminicoccaceae bacterium]
MLRHKKLNRNLKAHKTLGIANRVMAYFSKGLLTAIFIFANCSWNAFAESLAVQEVSFDSLVDTKKGVIDSCGIRFGAFAYTPDGKPLVINGSVNTVFPENKLPGLLIKFSLFGVSNDKVQQIGIAFGSMRTKTFDTKDLMYFTSDDGLSYLAHINVTANPAMVFGFGDEFLSGAWVSVSPDTSRGDYSFFLQPTQKDLDRVAPPYLQCSAQASQAFLEQFGEANK